MLTGRYSDDDLPLASRTARALDLPTMIGNNWHSEWLLVDQGRVNDFADLTMDHQWIHVDPERADREGTQTIVHGFLTLTLFPRFAANILKITDYSQALNYGFDKLRFTGTVPVGARIRMKMTIADVTPRGNALTLRRHCEIEVEGRDRPAIVADWLTLFYPN